MRKIKFGIFLVLLMSTIFTHAQRIIPAPLSYKPSSGHFTFTPTTYMLATDFQSYMDGFTANDYFIKYCNLPIKTSTKIIGKGQVITLLYDSTLTMNDGGYILNIEPNTITITGKNEGGVFHGLITLMQMVEKSAVGNFQIPCGVIEDYPQFSYRGMHLDCARHFFEVDFIKAYIDYLALYKMNTFHWHLTDDQGWRIEIKQYPKLTSIGAWRDGSMVGHYREQKFDTISYGGFYTQRDIKEIVKYATARHISIIPEIEMPGHCVAALASYPELGCVQDTTYKVEKLWGVLDEAFCPTDETFTFLENVLDEVMELFPSKMIHIGGDEVEKTRWKSCKHCQQLIKDNNLIDEHGLQGYFINRIETYVNSKGRNIVGWDEILEGGLNSNATIMSWRGEEGGIQAASQNHYAIMTPGSYCYFDYYQGSPLLEPLAIGGFTTLEKVYSYNPIPASLPKDKAKYILGAQGNVWTEYINYPENVEYMMMPRMLALSEVLWSPSSKKNYDDFIQRLLFHFTLLDKTNVNYAKSIYQVNYTITQDEGTDALKIALNANAQLGTISVVEINKFNGNKNQFNYVNPFNIDASTPYIVANLTGSIKNPPITNIKINYNKATGKKVILKNEPSKKYAAIGPLTLVNGIEATVNPSWSSAEWLGFNGGDFEAIVDMGKIDSISSVSIGFLFDRLSWIYPPQTVQIYVSNNGKNFDSAGKQTITNTDKRVAVKINSSIKTGRYVKIVATNYGTIPQHNPGAGSKPWLFVDEIGIE